MIFKLVWKRIGKFLSISWRIWLILTSTSSCSGSRSVCLDSCQWIAKISKEIAAVFAPQVFILHQPPVQQQQQHIRHSSSAKVSCLTRTQKSSGVQRAADMYSMTFAISLSLFRSMSVHRRQRGTDDHHHHQQHMHEWRRHPGVRLHPQWAMRVCKWVRKSVCRNRKQKKKKKKKKTLESNT